MFLSSKINNMTPGRRIVWGYIKQDQRLCEGIVLAFADVVEMLNLHLFLGLRHFIYCIIFTMLELLLIL